MERRMGGRTLVWGGALVLPALLVLLFETRKWDRALMERWVSGVMAPVEQQLGRLWGRIPWCSVAELLTALLLTSCVLWLVWTVAGLLRRRDGRALGRRLLVLASVLLWLWCGFCWMWNAAYYASSFQEKSGLRVQPYPVETLIQVTALFAQRAAEFSTQVERDGDGRFAVDRDEILARGPEVYEDVSREFPFLALEGQTRAKPIFFSRLQSRLGFTGVYFPFTGEANVNVDAPACLLPATVAHEMAHQRMVASEQEANFVGILAAVTSGGPVYQYSGYLMGLIQLCNALAPVDRAAWQDIVQRYFTQELADDWNANNAYWAALASPMEDAAEQVYDSFLKGNGQELGMRSYGACVDLLAAYFGGGQA